MNDMILQVGQCKDGYYYAMWANYPFVYQYKTLEEAITRLLLKRYPSIWHMNDMDSPSVMKKGVKVDDEDKGIGRIPSKFFDREFNKHIDKKYRDEK